MPGHVIGLSNDHLNSSLYRSEQRFNRNLYINGNKSSILHTAWDPQYDIHHSALAVYMEVLLALVGYEYIYERWV